MTKDDAIATLRKYVAHSEFCDRSVWDVHGACYVIDEQRPCTCGLADALAQTDVRELSTDALELLGRLVNHGTWYGSAIELDQHVRGIAIDGEAMLKEAEAILRDAGWRESGGQWAPAASL